MNDLLQLKGVMNKRRNTSAPGRPKLKTSVCVNVDDVKKVKDELDSISNFWKKNNTIGGALVSVHYNDIIAKSNRIKNLLSRGSEHSNDYIVGAKFNNDYSKHITTYFVDLSVLENNILKLENVIDLMSEYFNGVISDEDLENINLFNEKIREKGMSKTLFSQLIVDVSHVDKLSVPDSDGEIEEESIISIYKTAIDTEILMKQFGIDIPKSRFLDSTTFLINPRDASILKQNAPYLIAMSTTDLSTYDYEVLENDEIESNLRIGHPTIEPTIGVIDTLFDESVYFSEWVEFHNLIDSEIPLTKKDYEHGTAVSSIIVDGPGLNNYLDDGCGNFKVRHFGVAVHGAMSSFRIIKQIQHIVETNPDIHVWNLSLGSNYEINQNFMSPEAYMLDQIQYKYNVIFVIAGTNKNDKYPNVNKIGSPADSINSLVVNSVAFDGTPADYSRTGPVLSFFNKPDLSYYGGTDELPIMATISNDITKYVTGTSFAAPWISRKLSYLIDVLGLTRETAKALLIDSATKWEMDDEEKLKIVGYGVVPIKIEDIIKSANNEIKFFVEGESDYYDTYTYSLPIPVVEEQHPFVAKATMCYFPKCSRKQGVDYSDTELDLVFGRNNGERIIPINDNYQSDSDGHYTHENNARKHFRKWDNIKHVNQILKEGTRAKKAYQNGLWGISVKRKERLERQEDDTIKFAIVITLKEITNANRIEEFIRQCSLRNWLVTRINVENKIDVYNTAEEEIIFE